MSLASAFLRAGILAQEEESIQVEGTPVCHLLCAFCGISSKFSFKRDQHTELYGRVLWGCCYNTGDDEGFKSFVHFNLYDLANRVFLCRNISVLPAAVNTTELRPCNNLAGLPFTMSNEKILKKELSTINTRSSNPSVPFLTVICQPLRRQKDSISGIADAKPGPAGIAELPWRRFLAGCIGKGLYQSYDAVALGMVPVEAVFIIYE